MNQILKLIKLLTVEERKNGAIIVFMVIVMALLDMVGVASIMPFMAVLSDLSLIKKNEILSFLYSASGVTSEQQFLIAFGVLVFALSIFSLSYKSIVMYILAKFSMMCEYSIGYRILNGYLDRSYEWHLSKHSSDQEKIIIADVAAVVHQGILPFLNLTAQLAVAIAIFILLIIVNWMLAFTALFTLGMAYIAIYKFMGVRLKNFGDLSLDSNQKRFMAVNQALTAVKEIKLAGLNNTYVEKYRKPAKQYAHAQSMAITISQTPRNFIEAIAFGGMILVMVYLISQGRGISGMIPIVSLFAFSGLKLMPALQQIYFSFSQMRFIGPALDNVYREIGDGVLKCKHVNHISQLPFESEILFKDVNYTYPNSLNPAVRQINLKIPAFAKVAFVGTTGSGKSTILNLLLGLLTPQVGQILIDGNELNNGNFDNWRNQIGYVPQEIYLLDDTIASNIAFGISKEDIDLSAVEYAAKLANLHEFVVRQLPDGYSATVGERGVRLSGGQRQRIGIARALYHRPKILIFDEATSALDNITEFSVMESIKNIDDKITVILVAHRLSSVSYCDTIFMVENGEVCACGSYPELLDRNTSFRSLAKKY